MSVHGRRLPQWFWPKAKAESTFLVRVGRSLHWLGYGFGALFLLVALAAAVTGGLMSGSHLESAPFIEKKSSGNATEEGPWRKYQEGAETSQARPDWMADAVSVSPGTVQKDVPDFDDLLRNPSPRDLLADNPLLALESSSIPRRNSFGENMAILLVALGFMSGGRVLRYVLANE